MKQDEDKYRRMRERFADCQSAEAALRTRALDDLKFIWVPGSQWDDSSLANRDKRPKYEFNKLRQMVKKVVNDLRMNTPSIKIRATEDGDAALAELRRGLIRNIETQSRADEAYDWGGLYAVSGGFGAWRVRTAYTDDDSFDQDIRIERIHNPFSVHFDPHARALDRSDARFAFVEESIPRVRPTPLPATATPALAWYPAWARTCCPTSTGTSPGVPAPTRPPPVRCPIPAASTPLATI